MRHYGLLLVLGWILQPLAASGQGPVPLPARTTRVTGAVFSPDGKQLVVCYGDDKDCLWKKEPTLFTLYEAATGKEVRSWCAEGWLPRALAWLPGTNHVLSVHDRWKFEAGKSGSLVTVWDVKTGKAVRGMDAEESRNCWWVSLSGDGKRMLGVAGAEMRLYDVATFKMIQMTRPTKDRIEGATLSFDGSSALVCDEKAHALSRWDTSIGQQIRFVEETDQYCWGSIALAKDDRCFASIGGARNRKDPLWMKVRDFRTNALIRTFEYQWDEKLPIPLQFTDDTKRLLTIVDQVEVRLLDIEKGKSLWKWQPPKEQAEPLVAAMAPDGARVCVAWGRSPAGGTIWGASPWDALPALEWRDRRDRAPLGREGVRGLDNKASSNTLCLSGCHMNGPGPCSKR